MRTHPRGGSSPTARATSCASAPASLLPEAPRDRSDDRAYLREVAADEVAVAVVDQLRHLGRADVLRLPAAGPETAAGRRVDRAGHVALQDDPFAALLQV